MFAGLSSHGPQDWPAWGAAIRNASDLPAYEVQVYFCIDDAGDWRSGERYRLPQAVTLVPPGGRTEELPGEIRKQEADSEGNDARWLIALEFTDAAGQRWLRDPRGHLLPAAAS